MTESAGESLTLCTLVVNNIVELLEKLADKKMVVLIDEPEMKEKFVLSARMYLNPTQSRSLVVDKGFKRLLQFKKKEEMNEKIEGCRTYEEDDDILLSL
ncbi:hypothetical protein Tco_0611742 [Tanacetum coccineum]